jgi:hypothetical protein
VLALLSHVQVTPAKKSPFLIADRYLWQWESEPSFHFSRLPLPPSREYLPLPLECCDFGVRFADWCTMRGVRIAACINESMVELACDASSESSSVVELLELLPAQLSSHEEALRSSGLVKQRCSNQACITAFTFALVIAKNARAATNAAADEEQQCLL